MRDTLTLDLLVQAARANIDMSYQLMITTLLTCVLLTYYVAHGDRAELETKQKLLLEPQAASLLPWLKAIRSKQVRP